MPSKTTGAKTGDTGGTKGARHRPARRAVKSAAKATWFVSRKVAKRKARKHARRYGDVARTAWSAALIYGPMAAEVLGAVEQPKRRRRFPAFLAGMAVGGGLTYLAARGRTA
jgi:type IV secretory pathway TrbL component